MKIFLPIISNGMNLVRANYVSSLLRAFTRRSIVVANINYPYPDGAMNIAAACFMNSDCDVMFIIDGDHVFEPADVDHLLEHEEEPLVFGFYCKRMPAVEYVIQSFDDEFPKQEGKFLICKSAARGFSVWRKRVFEIMQPECKPYKCTATGHDTYEYFRNHVGGHSEDFEFCERWRSLGQRVLVDPRVFVRHIGDCSFPIKHENLV